MKNQFKQLIADYRKGIDKSVALLRKNAASFDYYKEIRKGSFDKEKNIKFSFHGIGCLITFGEVYVDFDFVSYTTSSIPRYDAINTWFLSRFWKSKKEEYPAITNYNDVADKLFPELVQDGFLVKGRDHDDYFLKTDLENYTNDSVLFPSTFKK